MARSKSDDAEEIKEHAKLSKSTLNTGLKIFSYTKPYRTYYIVGMFFLILSTFTVMGLPYFLTGLTELALNKPFFVLGKNAQDALFIINDIGITLRAKHVLFISYDNISIALS